MIKWLSRFKKGIRIHTVVSNEIYYLIQKVSDPFQILNHEVSEI